MTQEHIDTHNRQYNEAWRLIEGQIFLDGITLPVPNWFVRRRLRKAFSLFQKALAINPTGWNSMFALGKIEQRLGRRQESLKWFLKAREFSPDNTSLAKETSLTASQLGMYEMGAQIADEAIGLNPRDAALIVNAGLAHICSGNTLVALDRFQRAATIEPDQRFTAKLVLYAQKVSLKELPSPQNESDILRAIKRM